MTLQSKREEILGHYRRSFEELRKAIESLSECQMTEQSVDGWSVKDNLAHVAFWHNLRAEEIGRISAGHNSVWRITDEEDELINAIVLNARRGIPLSQVLWELDNSRERLLHALGYATNRGLNPSLYGEAGLRSDHEFEHARYIQGWRQNHGI
jgi:hypothetical protein